VTCDSITQARPLEKSQQTTLKDLAKARMKAIRSATSDEMMQDSRLAEIDDDTFDQMCKEEGDAQAFCSAMRSAAELLRRNSIVCGHHFAEFVLCVSANSSLVSTLPVCCVFILRDVVKEGPDFLKDTFTAFHRRCFDHSVGQPLLSGIIDNIITSRPANESEATDSDIENWKADAQTILNFLIYVCDSIALTLPPSDRLRLLQEGRSVEEKGFWAIQTVARPDFRAYDTEEIKDFVLSGVQYPSWPKQQDRGTYQKDLDTSSGSRRKADPDLEDNMACEKNFTAGKSRTGEC